MIGSDLAGQVSAWIRQDPDPVTRAELQALLDAGDEQTLAARFAAPLRFGTAGIRGPLGAGPARMNRAVVRRITAGVAARLRAEHPHGSPLVVVGRDARHGSEAFATEACETLAGAGFAVRRYPDPVPTPLVAFAVRHLGAVAGVQITASHNPPADNGYKVYWADGAQIAEPLDTDIAAAADAVHSAVKVRTSSDGVTDVGPDLLDAYRAACLRLSVHREGRDLRIVYTPLHGVAGPIVGALLADAGFHHVQVVAEQGSPDPDFPTVSFPNPEEPGALDLALELAAREQADLVLANDPDGDRIAAAVPGPDGWRALSGDEIGCLLAEWLLMNTPGGSDRTVATTVVSSQLLRRIAAHHRVAYAETLTGFKWLARAAAEAATAGRPMILAYEQALGAMCGDAVRDKDGISAALVLAELAAARRAQGSSIPEALDEVAARHGVHLTAGRSVRLDPVEGERLVAEALGRLRREPPSQVLAVAVTATEDRRAGVRRERGAVVRELDTPPTDLVGLELADGSRLQIRPSGTEPLLKLYIEVVEPVAGADVAAARRGASQRLGQLADAFEALVLPGV